MPDLPQFAAAPKVSAKRARTRARLIEAAAQAIGEKGFRGTTLDEVAARAGLTKGAIYGNFESKEDLFLAVVEAGRTRAGPTFEKGLTLRQQMRRLGERVAAIAPGAQARAAMTVELELYALTHDAMRLRLNAAHDEARRRSIEHVRETMGDLTLPTTPEAFVILMNALIGGILHQRFMNPALVTDEVIIAAFEALAGPQET